MTAIAIFAALGMVRHSAGTIQPPRVRCPDAAALTYQPDQGKATKLILENELLPPAVSSLTARSVDGVPLSVGVSTTAGVSGSECMRCSRSAGL